MQERDRLIELIKKGVDISRNVTGLFSWGDVADYLLANGVIVPPCKVGDTVWWATTSVDENCEEKPDIEIGKVVSFSIHPEGLWAYCRYESGLTFWHLVADYFGKTVFLTKAEAKEKLKELGK